MIQGDDPCADMEQRSVEAFRQLKGVLEKNRFLSTALFVNGII